MALLTTARSSLPSAEAFWPTSRDKSKACRMARPFNCFLSGSPTNRVILPSTGSVQLERVIPY